MKALSALKQTVNKEHKNSDYVKLKNGNTQNFCKLYCGCGLSNFFQTCVIRKFIGVSNTILELFANEMS